MPQKIDKGSVKEDYFQKELIQGRLFARNKDPIGIFTKTSAKVILYQFKISYGRKKIRNIFIS